MYKWKTSFVKNSETNFKILINESRQSGQSHFQSSRRYWLVQPSASPL